MLRPIPLDAEPAPCTDPAVRELVDRAFENARGPAAARMREKVCTGCPYGIQCLAFGIDSGEPGVYGGANRHDRELIRRRRSAA